MWVPLAIWVVVCAIAFGGLAFSSVHMQAPAKMLLAVGGLAAVVRIVPVLLYPESKGVSQFDIENFYRTATAILDGRDVYALPVGTYPYPPLHLYVFAAAKGISDSLDVSFFVLVRIPQALADVGTAILVADVVRRSRGPVAGWQAGALYALCPLPVLATVYHGQFDAVPTFFAVLAYWALVRGHGRTDWYLLSSAALALGTLEKAWPAMLLPVFLLALPDNARRARYAGMFVLVGALVTMSYIIAFDSTIGRLFDTFDDYPPIFARFSGLGLVVDRTFGDAGSGFLRWFVEHGRRLSLGAALAANVAAIGLRLSPCRSAIVVLSAIYITSPEAHAYHLLWIVPFGLMDDDRGWTAVFAVVAAAPYAIALLLAGGMFAPANQAAPAEWLSDHRWWLEYAVWLVALGWLLRVVARALMDSRSGGEPSAQAA